MSHALQIAQDGFAGSPLAIATHGYLPDARFVLLVIEALARVAGSVDARALGLVSGVALMAHTAPPPAFAALLQEPHGDAAAVSDPTRRAEAAGNIAAAAVSCEEITK